MSVLTTTAGVGGILPHGWGPLIVEPVMATAVCLDPRVSTIISTGEVAFHLPVINTDAAASWLQEATEIAQTAPGLSEIVVTPAKVGGLVVISAELAADSSPAATQVVGMGLARSIAAKVDQAFFGSLASPAPAGLGSLTNSAVSRIIAGTAPTTLDAFAQAISAVEQDGTSITAFVANPADALTVQTLKVSSGSAQPLLGTDATNGTARQILGIPLLVSPKVTAGTIWGVAASRNIVVLRTDTNVAVSRDAFFTSDQIAVRATMRVGFAFATPKAIAKIALAAT